VTVAPTVGPAQLPTFPPPEPGLRTLATVARRVGGLSLPPVTGRAGDMQVTILCTGGTLVLDLAPVTRTTIPCATGAITPSRNVFHLNAPQTFGIRVEVGSGVHWNLRVEQ
jgi:hypothetical protein